MKLFRMTVNNINFDAGPPLTHYLCAPTTTKSLKPFLLPTCYTWAVAGAKKKKEKKLVEPRPIKCCLYLDRNRSGLFQIEIII